MSILSMSLVKHSYVDFWGQWCIFFTFVSSISPKKLHMFVFNHVTENGINRFLGKMILVVMGLPVLEVTKFVI